MLDKIAWKIVMKIQDFKTAEHWFWLLGIIQTVGFWAFIFTAFWLGVDIIFGLIWFLICLIIFTMAGKLKGDIYQEFQEEFGEFRTFLDTLNGEINFRRNKHEWNRN